MKKQIIKITFLVLAVIMLVGLCQAVALAKTEEKIIYKDGEGKYLVYYKDYLSSAYRFVITGTNTKPSITESKTSIMSGEDNVAYVYDETVLVEGKGYIWIIDESDNFVVSGEQIDINEAIDGDIIEKVNAEAIKVTTNETYSTTIEEDGVKKSIKLGKIVIKEEGNYEYQLVKVEEGSKAEELYKTAEELETEAGDTYSKLVLNKKFYDLYEELKPTSGWNEVENKEILQPEDSAKGDKYIVWLRGTDNQGTIKEDVKFLECDYEYEPEYKKADKEIKEVVRTPVTYDSGSLIVILASLVAGIIIVVIIKNRLNKKENH